VTIIDLTARLPVTPPGQASTLSPWLVIRAHGSVLVDKQAGCDAGDRHRRRGHH